MSDPKRAGRVLVAIDGPAGAGKSTAARRLAERLDAFYLDTGAMYRACTLRAQRLGADLQDATRLGEVVDGAEIELLPPPAGERNCRVLLDGEDVSEEIRSREVTSAIHHLASCPAVRSRLVAQQQVIASKIERSVVAEGRDLASVVYPNAEVKIYLDATVEERARRRRRDLEQAGETPPAQAELEAEIATRDRRDREREVGPLIQVPEAALIDSSSMSLDEVVDAMAAEVERAREAASPR